MSGDAAYPVKPGFSDPVYEAQRVFQLLQEAMAQPGVPVELDPVPVVAPLNAASMAICLAMLDGETPLWLDKAARLKRLEQHLLYHCDCILVDDPGEARYAVASGPTASPPLSRCGPIDEETGEGTILVIQVPSLTGAESGVSLAVDGAPPRPLGIVGLPEDFWRQPGLEMGAFDRQVDLVFTHGSELLALPRSIQISLS